MVATETKMSYADFTNKLNAAGIQTTYLSNGETNFEEYGNALSDELKQQITDSFDNEQDYKLQEQIAALYKNKSVIQSEDFISGCKSLGLNVKVEYQNTTYIVDEKLDGVKHSATNGAIAVYTISDGKGGEIKIADANGNGSLESEEIFMNQILGDINKDIKAGNLSAGTTPTAESGTVDSPNPPQEDISLENQDPKKEEPKEISQYEFNQKVEKYLALDMKLSEAIESANSELETNMNYTGFAKETKKQPQKLENELTIHEQQKIKIRKEELKKLGLSASLVESIIETEFNVRLDKISL